MEDNAILTLKDVSKHYPSFDLSNVSFELKRGEIMGFIGRNGAGKTTTLKAIIGLIDLDGGEILFDGKPLKENEKEAKEKMGILFGGIDFYPSAKVKALTQVSSRFFPSWDNETYKKLIKYFQIDEEKKIKELSNGMKVKYNLAVALSHNASILLLDEPTSGLDPVSRDELLDSLREIAKKKNTAILFSTHVISDLEKCADTITYIHNGKIVSSKSVSDFKKDYLQAKGSLDSLTEEKKNAILYLREYSDRYEGIIEKKDSSLFLENELSSPSLEEIMLGIERGESNEESPL